MRRNEQICCSSPSIQFDSLPSVPFSCFPGSLTPPSHLPFSLPLSFYSSIFSPSYITDSPRERCAKTKLFPITTNGQSSGWSIEAQLDWPAVLFFFAHLSLGTSQNLWLLWPIWGTRRRYSQPQSPSPPSPNKWFVLSTRAVSANPQPSANLEALFNTTQPLQ